MGRSGLTGLSHNRGTPLNCCSILFLASFPNSRLLPVVCVNSCKLLLIRRFPLLTPGQLLQLCLYPSLADSGFYYLGTHLAWIRGDLFAADDDLLTVDDHLLLADDDLMLADGHLVLTDDHLVLADDHLVLKDDRLVLFTGWSFAKDDRLVLFFGHLLSQDGRLVTTNDQLLTEDDRFV